MVARECLIIIQSSHSYVFFAQMYPIFRVCRVELLFPVYIIFLTVLELAPEPGRHGSGSCIVSHLCVFTKLLNLFKLQLPRLWHGDGITYLTELL